MPNTAYFAAFEILEAIIFFLCMRHALRAGPLSVARLLPGVVFGLVLELLTIYQIRAYHYGPFTIMVLEVPLAIGIAWGNQLYGARLFSDATSLPQWARPILDAILVIYLDLLVEPVATRLGFWDFGLPPDLHWFGTPYTNFWGFFWVVTSFSAGMRLLEKSARGYGRYLAGVGAVLVGLVATLAANAFMVFALEGTARIVATAIVLILALGTVISLRIRLVSPPPSAAWQFALFSMAFFLGIGLVSGALLKPPVLLGMSVLVCAGGALAYSYARCMEPTTKAYEALPGGADGSWAPGENARARGGAANATSIVEEGTPNAPGMGWMIDRALKSLIILTLSAFVYSAAAVPLLAPYLPLPQIPGGPIVASLVVIVFCLSHAIYALGWRHALAFFGISAIVSWALENAGVATGTIYGGYFYTALLGPRLGHVPILIPLSWFEYVYCSYLIANCLLSDRPIGTQLIRGGRPMLGTFLLLTLATAALTTAQDLVIDPIMSGEIFRAWVWETPGSYYGVPGRNFLGWMGTAFLVVGLYRLLEVWRSPQPGARLSPFMATLPVIVYGMNVVVSMSAIAPPGLKVIGPFVLGIPVLLTLGRIWLPTARQDLLDAQ